jgi:hypothetical protein
MAGGAGLGIDSGPGRGLVGGIERGLGRLGAREMRRCSEKSDRGKQQKRAMHGCSLEVFFVAAG